MNGKTIPKDAQYGKIHWIEMSNGKKAGLLGRTSLSSVKNRRKSSFSCGSTCQYNFTQQPFFDLQLPTTFATGGTQISNITEYDSMLNGNYYTYPVSYQSVLVTTDSSSVASAGPDSSTSTNIIEYGNAPGTTNVNNYFYDTEFAYDPPNEVCNATDNSSWQSGPTTVQTPDHLSVTADTGPNALNCPIGTSLIRSVNFNILDVNEVIILRQISIRETVDPSTQSSCNGANVNVTNLCTPTLATGNFTDVHSPSCPSTAALAESCGYAIPDQTWKWCPSSGTDVNIGDIGLDLIYNKSISFGGNSTGFSQGTTFPH